MIGSCARWRGWRSRLVALLGGVGAVQSSACSGSEGTLLSLPFAPAAACSEVDMACINDGVQSLDAGGARLSYKRIEGHPEVAMLVAFDGRVSIGEQYWSERLALDLLLEGGSQQLGVVEWPERWAQLGASLSGIGGGDDYAGLLAVAPKPNAAAAWQLLLDAFADPYRSDYELQSEQRILANAWAVEADDPDSGASIDAWARLFQGERYALARETRAVVPRLTLDSIARGWDALQVPTRVAITIVGDLEASEAVQMAEGLVRRWRPAPAGDAPPSAASHTASATPDVNLLVYPDSPTWHITSYFKGPSASDPDLLPLTLGANVLSQRLFDEIRDVRGLAYAVDCGVAFVRQTYVSLYLATEQPREALPLLSQAVRDLETAGPTERELEIARAAWRTGVLARSATPRGQAEVVAYSAPAWSHRRTGVRVLGAGRANRK